MDSVGIPWNSNIPLGIQQIPPELMGESKDLVEVVNSHPFQGGFYPPPQIPCGVHVESRSIPGVHVDFRQFSFGGNPANFLSRIHVESMWSPAGLQLLHLDNMDSTLEHREYELTQQDSIWTPHGFIAFNCLMLFII